jgi:hypothetical protein
MLNPVRQIQKQIPALAGMTNKNHYVVTAPSLAELTVAAYFAKTPRL